MALEVVGGRHFASGLSRVGLFFVVWSGWNWKMGTRVDTKGVCRFALVLYVVLEVARDTCCTVAVSRKVSSVAF